MKLKLWSDLHLEWRNYLYDHIFDVNWVDPNANKDTILLLAGDIGNGINGQEFIHVLCNHFKHVIRVAGNHDFWGAEYNATIEGWKSFELDGPKNFHFLHNDYCIIDGVRFLGGTMWTDFNDSDPLVMAAAHRIINDYREIKHNGEPIVPEFIVQEHNTFREFLLQEFDKPFDGKTVVMTHHSPGNEIRRVGRRRDSIGHAYFADMEHLIGWHNKAVLWTHGHTHQSFDYMINETRVVCNPYGYWGNDTNKNFNADLIIEI